MESIPEIDVPKIAALFRNLIASLSSDVLKL
jgi:hypothetical protein